MTRAHSHSQFSTDISVTVIIKILLSRSVQHWHHRQTWPLPCCHSQDQGPTIGQSNTDITNTHFHYPTLIVITKAILSKSVQHWHHKKTRQLPAVTVITEAILLRSVQHWHHKQTWPIPHCHSHYQSPTITVSPTLTWQKDMTNTLLSES